jgi:hypothetical protein
MTANPAPPTLLVTGASRGIGAATARLAAQRGWDVAINYTRDEAAAQAVAADVRAAGRRALVLQADVAVDAEVVALFRGRGCDLRLGAAGAAPLAAGRGLSSAIGSVYRHGIAPCEGIARRCHRRRQSDACLLHEHVERERQLPRMIGMPRHTEQLRMPACQACQVDASSERGCREVARR